MSTFNIYTSSYKLEFLYITFCDRMYHRYKVNVLVFITLHNSCQLCNYRWCNGHLWTLMWHPMNCKNHTLVRNENEQYWCSLVKTFLYFLILSVIEIKIVHEMAGYLGTTKPTIKFYHNLEKDESHLVVSNLPCLNNTNCNYFLEYYKRLID